VGVASPQERSARQKAVLLRIVRIAFVVLLATVTLLNIVSEGTAGATTSFQLQLDWVIKIAVAVALGVAAVLVDRFTPTKKISTVSGIFFGLLVGIVATLALGFVVDLIGQVHGLTPTFVNTVKVLIGISMTYLAISVVLQTQDDFRLVIPYVEFSKAYRGPRPLVVDTSALIDGRFTELARTALVHAPVIVPRPAIGELQALCDSGERLKRSRGKRGLDAIARLQRVAHLDVTVDDANVPGRPVDEQVIELARRVNGTVVTTDAGLQRVAQVGGLSVLNLHDLAGALRPSLTPGESLRLRLVRPGEQPGQGVGYLDDGTMVVAENGGRRIGDEVDLTVVSQLQTGAGRLIFARLTDGGGSSGGAGGGGAGMRTVVEQPSALPARGAATPDAPESGDTQSGAATGLDGEASAADATPHANAHVAAAEDVRPSEDDPTAPDDPTSAAGDGSVPTAALRTDTPSTLPPPPAADAPPVSGTTPPRGSTAGSAPPAPSRPRSPFPPQRPRSLRDGTPRNPRR
jgi:uncharacterized protein YacL